MPWPITVYNILQYSMIDDYVFQWNVWCRWPLSYHQIMFMMNTIFNSYPGSSFLFPRSMIDVRHFASPSHSSSWFSRFPITEFFLQGSSSQKPSLLSLDQCLLNFSHLYRPLSILAWIIAFSVSCGFVPAQDPLGKGGRDCSIGGENTLVKVAWLLRIEVRVPKSLW